MRVLARVFVFVARRGSGFGAATDVGEPRRARRRHARAACTRRSISWARTPISRGLLRRGTRTDRQNARPRRIFVARPRGGARVREARSQTRRVGRGEGGGGEGGRRRDAEPRDPSGERADRARAERRRDRDRRGAPTSGAFARRGRIRFQNERQSRAGTNASSRAGTDDRRAGGCVPEEPLGGVFGRRLGGVGRRRGRGAPRPAHAGIQRAACLFARNAVSRCPDNVACSRSGAGSSRGSATRSEGTPARVRRRAAARRFAIWGARTQRESYATDDGGDGRGRRRARAGGARGGGRGASRRRAIAPGSAQFRRTAGCRRPGPRTGRGRRTLIRAESGEKRDRLSGCPSARRRGGDHRGGVVDGWAPTDVRFGGRSSTPRREAQHFFFWRDHLGRPRFFSPASAPPPPS